MNLNTGVLFVYSFVVAPYLINFLAKRIRYLDSIWVFFVTGFLIITLFATSVWTTIAWATIVYTVRPILSPISETAAVTAQIFLSGFMYKHGVKKAPLKN